MLATPPAKRNARLKSLAEKYEFYVNIDPNDRDNLLKDTYPEYRKAAEETERKLSVAPVPADSCSRRCARSGIEATRPPPTSTSGAIFKTRAAWSVRAFLPS